MRGMCIGVVLALAVAGCGGDDDGSAATTAPSATVPRACVEAVDGFPDNGTALVVACDHLRDVQAATAMGGQQVTPGEAAVAVRELCVRLGGEDRWRTATPLCAEVSEVFPGD